MISGMSGEPGDSITTRFALVVLGMHRSGTSALTRVLNLAGAQLAKDLVPPLNGHNEAGFWEPVELVRLNEELLEATGSHWMDTGPQPPIGIEDPDVRAIVERAGRWLREEFGDASLIVLKDPRLCRLLRFWRPLLESNGWQPVFVHCLRHPNEVAASLRVRNGLDERVSYLLWLRHVLEAVHSTRDSPCAIASYSRLLRNWRPVVTRVFGTLGLPQPRLEESAVTEIDRFLSESLRHFRWNGSESDLPGWLARAYLAMRDEEVLGSGVAIAELDTIADELRQANELLWSSQADDPSHGLEPIDWRRRAAAQHRVATSWQRRCGRLAVRVAAVSAELGRLKQAGDEVRSVSSAATEATLAPLVDPNYARVSADERQRVRNRELELQRQVSEQRRILAEIHSSRGFRILQRLWRLLERLRGIQIWGRGTDRTVA